MRKISIREFEGLAIGQAENKAAATGCTVLLLGKNGARVMAQAILRAVQAAEPAYGLPAARYCLKN